MTKRRVNTRLIAFSSFLILLGFSALALDETAYEIISESYLLPMEEISIWLLLPMVLVFAPVVEEICFRLWVKPAYFWGIFLSLVFFLLVVQNLTMVILILLLVSLIAAFYKRLKALTGDYPAAAMVISGLLFSLVHAGNYSELHFAHFWLFLIYLGLGILLGMARLRFGLWAAILLHFSYNALVTVPVLPSWKGSVLQLESGMLIEHGMIEDDVTSFDYERKPCIECSAEKLIHSVAYRAFPKALVVVDTGGDMSFRKFTLETMDPMDPKAILEGLSERFQMRIDTSYQIKSEVQISFLNNPDFEPSADNFLKHRPKTMGGKTFPAARFLIPYLEKEYGVKMNCIENCEAQLVLPVKNNLSLEENLSNLADLGLITYQTEKREIKVITIEMED